MEFDKEYEKVIMQIIAASGGARSYAMEALALAKDGHPEEAEESLAEARTCLIEAQKVHGAILADSINNPGNTPLLTVHAEDQIMGAVVVIDMAGAYLDLYRDVHALRGGATAVPDELSVA